MWTRTDHPTPARKSSTFVDTVVRRASELTPLVEFFRAHLEARSSGASRSVAEHVVDLLSLGLRWRAHARASLRRATARPDHDAISALMIRLRACGRSPAEVARMNAWNEFAFVECCPEALDEACELAAWFELAADKALGQNAPSLEAQLELVRTEVVSRALWDRRPPTASAPAPMPPARPVLQSTAGQRATAARAATMRLLGRVTRTG